MAQLDLKSLAKNKVCGLGGWEESLGISRQMNSGQMAPGQKWYPRSHSVASHVKLHQAQAGTKLLLSLPVKYTAVALGYCPGGVPNPSPPLPSVLVQELMWAATISADVRQQLLFNMYVRGKDIKGILSLAARSPASSLFILLIYLITCIASVSGLALDRETRQRRLNHAYTGSERPAL